MNRPGRDYVDNRQPLVEMSGPMSDIQVSRLIGGAAVRCGPQQEAATPGLRPAPIAPTSLARADVPKRPALVCSFPAASHLPDGELGLGGLRISDDTRNGIRWTRLIPLNLKGCLQGERCNGAFRYQTPCYAAHLNR